MRLYIFLWDFNLGGVQKHSVTLANYFKSLHWDVTILYSSKEGYFLSQLDESVKLIEFNVPNTTNVFKLHSLFKKLKTLIPADSVVLCNGPNNFRQILRVNFFSQRWQILHILHNETRISPSPLRFLKIFEMRTLANKKKTRLVALTKAQATKYRSDFGISVDRVIPNFVNYGHGHLAEKNRISPKGVSIGRISFEKGFDVLVESLPQTVENTNVKVFGNGDMLKDEYRKKASQLGLNNIQFEDPTYSVFETCSRFDFFICSSRTEGFPLTVLEALSCGLPVVCTDFEGVEDIINHDNGIIVKRDDAKSLAEGIDSMIRSLKEGEFKSEDVEKTVERFSIEKVCQQYLDILIQ